MAEALYRKYRPQVFADVVGQDHIERTLKNALDQDQVSHAYLFCGPRGTGKTTTARLLAKALLCEHGPTSSPDGTCRDCVDIANGVHPDVYELDAASRTGVENVRDEIIGRVNFAPTRGKVKVYIIDEVHMLSTAAFNALLKTLEEPPDHVIFILCTTDPQKVPETIQSRCQRFDFHRLSNDEIVARLGAVCVGEGVEFEGDALDLIAHRAEGGMRNALTSLEQLIAFGENKVTVQGAEDLLGSLDTSDMAEIVTAIGKRDISACFNWTAGFVETGADLAQFARDMADHVRNMYVMSLVGSDAALDVSDAERRQLSEELRLFGPDRLSRFLCVLGDLISDLRTATNPRLCFEIALTRMVRPDSDLTLESLAERIEALESRQVATMPVAAAPAIPAPVVVPPRESPSAPVASVASASVRPATSTAAPAAAPAVHAAQPASFTSQPPAAGAPVASASPTAPAAQGADGIAALLSNPAALQRAWRSAVVAVKKEKVAYGVLFVNVKVRPADDGASVLVVFPADNPFAFNMAQKPDVQTTLQQAFSHAAGMNVPLRYTQAGAPSTQQPAQAPAPVASQSPRSTPTPAPAPRPVPTATPAAPSPASTLVSAPAPAYAPPVEEVPLDAYDGASSSYDESDGAASVPTDQTAAAMDFSKVLSDTMGGSVVFKEVDE